MRTLTTGIAGIVLGAGMMAGAMGRYRKSFEQESVLWETARVCAAW